MRNNKKIIYPKINHGTSFMEHTIDSFKYDCRHFRGYRPCDFAKKKPGLDCWNCKKYYSPYDKRILLIKQGEIGDVLRTTPLVRAIKEKWPKAYVTWLVEGKAEKFILNNDYIDEVVVYHPSQLLRFMIERFDLVINLDKDIASTTIASLANAEMKVGFGFSGRGHVYPLNNESDYKFITGASDTINKKNKLSYMEQIYQLTGLWPSNPEYLFKLPQSSYGFMRDFNDTHNLKAGDIVIGFNHGCGPKFQTRKWPLEHYAELGRKLLRTNPKIKILILGGPYEKEANRKLCRLLRQWQDRVIDAGTNNDIMDFCGIINACDLVVTGITMGLHVAIALKKKVIGLTGPIIKSEIDTFGLGPMLISTKHNCLGCFNEECNINPSCMEAIQPIRVFKEIKKLIR